MEFADYRLYTPGDDYRRIDWRAYARLERLFLRLFEAEENLPITLLIDCSDSMQYGNPPKATLATELAAALAYVALKCEDSVIIGALANHLRAYRRAGSGKHAIWTVGEFLKRLPRTGPTDLNRALYELGKVLNGPGLTIVLSDFLAPGGYQIGLRALRQLRQEVVLLQILAPDEIQPDLQGDWQLHDSEGPGSVEVSVTSQVLEAYRQRLQAFERDLAAFAHAHSMTYVLVPSDTALIDIVQRLLGKVGIVK